MKQQIRTLNVDAEVSSIPAGVRNQGDWLRTVTGDLSIPDNASFSFSGSIKHKFGQPQLLIPRIEAAMSWGLPAPAFFTKEGQIAETVSIDFPVFAPTILKGIPVARITGILTIYSGEEFTMEHPRNLKPVAQAQQWTMRDLLVNEEEAGISSVTVLVSSHLPSVPLLNLVVPQGLAVVAALNFNITTVRTSLERSGWTRIGSVSVADVAPAGTSADLWIVPQATLSTVQAAWFVGVHSVRLRGLASFESTQKPDVIEAAELIAKAMSGGGGEQGSTIKAISGPMLMPSNQNELFANLQVLNNMTYFDIAAANQEINTGKALLSVADDQIQPGDKMFVVIHLFSETYLNVVGEVFLGVQNGEPNSLDSLNNIFIYSQDTWKGITIPLSNPIPAEFQPNANETKPSTIVMEFDAVKFKDSDQTIDFSFSSGLVSAYHAAAHMIWASSECTREDIIK